MKNITTLPSEKRKLISRFDDHVHGRDYATKAPRVVWAQ